MTITTHEATIKSLTIEVKVMKIGNRQVTLAVFRQLRDEQIIHPETSELCGIPWGRVNYHVGCEDISSEHIHVVWQKGEELCRCIPKAPSRIRELRQLIQDNTQAWVAARILEGWTPKITNGETPRLSSQLVSVALNGRSTSIYYPKVAQLAWHRTIATSELVLHEDELKQFIYGNALPLESKSIENITLPLQEELEKIIHAWQQSYKQLSELDQLFIAV